jgi:hypothetical protein
LPISSTNYYFLDLIFEPPPPPAPGHKHKHVKKIGCIHVNTFYLGSHSNTVNASAFEDISMQKWNTSLTPVVCAKG